jgi:hypothetical protein
MTYNEILKATRSVTPETTSLGNKLTPSPLSTAPLSAKRGRDEVDEENDMDLDDADDEARFGGRTSFTPFVQSA